MREAAQQKALLYDKAGEEHYNLISALHKSLRDSDPDAALYWLARMLEAGEDPLYVARRLVRFASEDVGNADPARAARSRWPPRRPTTSSARPRASWRSPRRRCYLALAPKSNAVYAAWNAVRRRHPGAAGRAGAAAPAQRADRPHERPGLRPRLPVRARRARRAGEPGAPARRAARPRVLPAHRPRRREGDRRRASPSGGRGGSSRSARERSGLAPGHLPGRAGHDAGLLELLRAPARSSRSSGGSATPRPG